MRIFAGVMVPSQLIWRLVFLAGCLFLAGQAYGLQPFPFSAGQSGTVACLQNPAISYTIYLPPAYSTNGPPLPIIYTLNPSGGGMVSSFQNSCSTLNVICVGVIGANNNEPWNPILRSFYAIPLDIRQRVLFDPTAVYAGGFSGGGEGSYLFSRFWSQHVAGVFTMGGWLGRVNTSSTTVPYYTTDRVQTNLLVARATGTTDTATIFYKPFDSNFLASCGAVVQDWSFVGGHVVPPGTTITACLSWLLTNRIPAGPYDQTNSMIQAANWRTRIVSGDTSSVLSECVTTLMNQPRSWFALQAQLVLDDLMTNYSTFRTLNVSNLFPASTTFTVSPYTVNASSWSPSDCASDLFFYYGRGAATNNARQQYYCALKALTGIAGISGDRAGDLYYVLTNFSYAKPLLNMSAPNSGQTVFHLSTDTDGLTYTLQARTNMVNDVWQSASIPAPDVNAVWSANLPFDPTSQSGFYRVATTPVPNVSPRGRMMPRTVSDFASQLLLAIGQQQFILPL